MNGEMDDEEWIIVGAFSPASKYRNQPLGWYVGRAVMTGFGAAARGERAGVDVTGVAGGCLVGELNDGSTAALFYGFGARFELDRAQVEAVSLSPAEWLAGGPAVQVEEGEEEPDAFDATAATPAPTPEHDEEGEEEPDAWPDGGEDRESRHSGVGLAPGWHEQIAAAQQQRTLRVEGRTFERVRYGVQQGRGKARWPCPDCAVAEGQYHVAGCDAEQCPRCGWEGIGCECHRGDDDGLDDDDQLADA